MRYDFDLARQARSVKHIEPRLTTHQAYYGPRLKEALNSPAGQTVFHLMDDDGLRQFVLGVDALDDEEVRIGFE